MRAVWSKGRVTSLLLVLVTIAVSARSNAVAGTQAAAGRISQLAELTASDGQAGYFLGTSVSVSGNVAVVGAPYATVGSNVLQGAAYIFVKPNTGWTNMTQTAKLTASDGQTFYRFGTTVAISGDTVVVGESVGLGYTLEVYVFVKPAGGWTDMTETAKLTSSDNNSEFGYSVAIGGNTVAVGAGGAGCCEVPGSIYLFVRPSSGWTSTTQTAKLTLLDDEEPDELGASVSVSGDVVVGGAPGWNEGQGAVYIFMKPAGGWVDTTQTAELLASDGVRGDQLGWSVSLSGSTLVGGAPDATVGFNELQGAAYVFVEPTKAWTDGYETAKLTVSGGEPAEQAGYAVSIAGGTVVVGAPNATVGSNQGQGATYVFLKPAGGWRSMTQITTVTASDGAAGDIFGTSVSAGGSALLIGAPHQNGNDTEAGAAYVFGP
jgi:hypothetical protein